MSEKTLPTHTDSRCPHGPQHPYCGCDFKSPCPNPFYDAIREVVDTIPENLCGVYILHFAIGIGNPDRPQNLASHYVGSAIDIKRRILRHLSGHSRARLPNVANVKGVRWWPAKIIPCASESECRILEKKIKNRHNIHRNCPECQATFTIGGKND